LHRGGPEVLPSGIHPVLRLPWTRITRADFLYRCVWNSSRQTSQPEDDAPEVQEIWGMPFGASPRFRQGLPRPSTRRGGSGIAPLQRRTLAQTTAPPHLTYEIASSGYNRNGRVWPLGLC